jgi:ferredoxin-NADP reductase
MVPFVLLGGVLIVRKIRRFDLVLSFFMTVAVTLMGLVLFTGLNLSSTASRIVLYSPLLFFAFVMLTEPLTIPPTKRLQIIYGVIVGFLFVPQVHLGSLYFTPELALIIGNIFAYGVSIKEKYQLVLKEKIQIANGVFDYVFPRMNFSFQPGQYLEWTLPHQKSDSRGDRRYFTIASSPTERNLRIGVKFYDQPSSYKKELENLKPGREILSGQLAGDFTLPRDRNKKMVFFAGGIGITPFRSMVKYLIDKDEKRSIVLLYSNRTVEDIAYKEVFDMAEEKIDLKTIYTLTDQQPIPSDWTGNVGLFDEKIIKSEIPDYLERLFYLSGPRSMVDGFKVVLKELGVKNSQIITDYFPGFA